MLLVFLQTQRVLPNILQPEAEWGWINYEMQFKDKKTFHQSTKSNDWFYRTLPKGLKLPFSHVRGDVFYGTYLTNVAMLDLMQAAEVAMQMCDVRPTTAELLYDFLEFMVKHFDESKYCFDVPNGCLTKKTEITRAICNIDTDPDIMPEYHPYYIIDPFDVNHNPGKAVKF